MVLGYQWDSYMEECYLAGSEWSSFFMWMSGACGFLVGFDGKFDQPHCQSIGREPLDSQFGFSWFRGHRSYAIV